jgi:radical SAM superfamily enzyme YgiQ (UPF0313 family)
MRVLLVNSPYPLSETPHVALSLPCLAAVLEEAGEEVQIADFLVTKYSLQNIERILKQFKPDIVGATSVTLNYPLACRILKACKEIDPKLITIIGGPHVTFNAEGTLREAPSIDIVVRREGEETIIELIETIEKDGDISEVRGIAFRKDSEIVITQERPLIQDLDRLPSPARHLLPLSRYLALQAPCGLMTSRGCPYGCIFCVGHRMVGKKVRFRDPIMVVDEMENIKSMGFDFLSFEDDFFTVNHKHCFSVCDEIIRRNLSISWGAYARVDSVDRVLLEKMKEAGCTSLCYGVESGNQKILDLIKKKITVDKIREAAELSREVGYGFIASFIAGLPGETEETLEESMNFAKSIGDGAGFHILAPFPGTEVRERATEYGIKILTDDWERYDANQVVCEPVGLSGDIITKVVEDWTSACDRIYESWMQAAKRGELPDKELKTLQAKQTQEFLWQLLQGEVIEKEGKIRREGNPLEIEKYIAELERRVWNALPFPLELVETQIEGLIEKKCLKYQLEDEYLVWRWDE